MATKKKAAKKAAKKTTKKSPLMETQSVGTGVGGRYEREQGIGETTAQKLLRAILSLTEETPQSTIELIVAVAGKMKPFLPEFRHGQLCVKGLMDAIVRGGANTQSLIYSLLDEIDDAYNQGLREGADLAATEAANARDNTSELIDKSGNLTVPTDVYLTAFHE